jgi:hypothetical protein
VWRPRDNGEEVVVEALIAGGAWAGREEKKSGERCGGEWWVSPLYRGRGGGRQPVIKTEEWPTLMGMKWLTLKWQFTSQNQEGGWGKRAWDALWHSGQHFHGGAKPEWH